MNAALLLPSSQSPAVAGAGDSPLPLDSDYGAVIRRGLGLLALGFGGFLLWASKATQPP